jgi:hypothetical protein
MVSLWNIVLSKKKASKLTFLGGGNAMKKKKTNNLRCWAIGVLAIVLLATPSAWAQGYVDCDLEGSPYNFYTDDILGLNIWPDATVNLYTSVPYVFVAPGGILNIFSGSIIMLAINTAGTGETDALVTVYGTDFVVDGVDTVATEFKPDKDFGSLLIATDENGNSMDVYCYSNTPIKLVDIENDENEELIIDIKPGSDENCINLKSRGVVPVAVLSEGDFVAGNINPDTVEFAGASPVRSSLCDVDKDGDMDMLFHFRTQDLTELNEDSTEATLKAMLKGVSMLSSAAAADALEGTDKVKIMSSKKYSSSGKHAPKPKQYTSKHKKPMQYASKDKRSDRKHKDR